MFHDIKHNFIWIKCTFLKKLLWYKWNKAYTGIRVIIIVVVIIVIISTSHHSIADYFPTTDLP